MIETLLKEHYPWMDFTFNVEWWIKENSKWRLNRKQIICEICKLLMQISEREKKLWVLVAKDFDTVIRDEVERIAEEMWAVNI